ncbi:hypothetical protein B0H13DRAFT_1914471 [Mycena leptocephala]|nr:hypothetical protein B0H13DRAFT_1914471 [Mycena leptocephala]
MSNQCALDARGNPLPTEDIVFYHSESDDTPLLSSKGLYLLLFHKHLLIVSPEPRRSTRQRQTDKLTQSLAAEKQDKDGNSIPTKVRAPVRKAVRQPNTVVFSSDEDDNDFEGSSSDSDSSDDSDSCPSLMSLDNDEIAAMLPSKTFPANVYRLTTDSRKEEEKRKAKNAKAWERAKTKKCKQRGDAGEEPPRKKSHRVSAGAVDSEGNPSHAGGSKDGGKASRTKNLIYLFFEPVDMGANGTVGSPGNRHYKCFHGARKVLTITRAMKSSLNGLQSHLRTKFPIMHRFYEAMSRRSTPLHRRRSISPAGLR